MSTPSRPRGIPSNRATGGLANHMRMSQSSPSRNPGSRQEQFTRPFSLHEALPYSPFTSIAPFNPDIIPMPNLGSASPATSLIDAVDTSEYDALNASARDGQPPSRSFEQTLAIVANLVNRRQGVPEYIFNINPEATTDTSSMPSIQNSLEPFAKAVVEQTSIAYRYPTPDTPGKGSRVFNRQVAPSAPGNGNHAAMDELEVAPPRTTSTSTAHPSVAANWQAHAVNGKKIEIHLSAQKSTHSLPKSPASTTAAITPTPVQAQQPFSPSEGSSAPAMPVSTRSETSRPPPTPSTEAQPQRQTITPVPVPGPPRPSSKVATPSPLPPGSGSRTETPIPVPVASGAAPQRRETLISAPTTNVLPRQSSSSASGKVSKIAVELRRTNSLNPDEYKKVVVPAHVEPPEPESVSKENQIRQNAVGQSLGHRDRSLAAYQNFMLCLQEAFQAEDHLLRTRQGNGVAFFVGDPDDDETTTTLSANIQRKLQSLLEKTIELESFRQVPLVDLMRLVQLSEGALKHAASLDITIDETWGDQEVQNWLQNLSEVDAGLKAARTTLRIMCGGREEKQLYSEERIEQSLDLLRRVLDGIIVPLAELRNTSETFKLLSQQKAQIGHIITTCQKLFALLTKLISKIDTSETVTNTLETLSTRLIFIETAPSEKESVIETHRFDGLRLVAMDLLSQVFLLNPELRQGIFNEILTSLEKLPVGKQRARQFKIGDGTSIQPVSALIMRLVQASAGEVDKSKDNSRLLAVASMEAEDNERIARNGRAGPQRGAIFSVRTEQEGGANPSQAIAELQDVLKPLSESAIGNASYVVSFIVKRALRSTKTGDTPYRNLLDLFVEDFTSCLNNSEWPASELLLRYFAVTMVNLVDDQKSPAPAKNMALEVLGLITAAVSRIRSYVRKAASALDTTSDGGELGRYLAELSFLALDSKCRPDLMVSWSGPYRAVLEHLEARFADDQHLSSAISFLTTFWAHKLGITFDNGVDDDDVADRNNGQLAYRLRMMILDRKWLANEYSFASVSSQNARLAYAITLLGCQLCESFSVILNILLRSMASDQATVRSKSLRSIEQVLETDPSILDGNSLVVQLILQCSNDASTQVRDSALTLIGKCIDMRPTLEEQMTETIINRFPDTGLGVRKRAMKLAKVIYLRNADKAVRSKIASALLFRVNDPEESVRDLALQMIEEIWFAPFYGGNVSAESRISLADHVALMVQTYKQGNVGNVLEKVLETMLGPTSKSAQATSQVCAKIVESLFDMVNNVDSDDPSVPSGRDALQVLMVYAKVDAGLFTFEQIRLLKPYIESLASDKTSDRDFAVGRAVIVIYRRVLPRLSKAHTEFLTFTFDTLFRNITNVIRLIDDVFACLWILGQLLGPVIIDKLARLVASSLGQIHRFSTMNPEMFAQEEKRRGQFRAYSLISGHAGKHCDLDSRADLFRVRIPSWKGQSVSRLMVDVMAPFADRKWPQDMRQSALDAVGITCQSWPKNYNVPNVYTTFQKILDEQNPALEDSILGSLKEFLLVEEKRSEQASSEVPDKALANSTQTRELTVMGGTSHDDVASGTAQRFLKEITRISLGSQDAHAFLATEVLASINRQGLVHPKETGVTFMTLETSTLPEISNLAFKEHKALHEKHETVLEREYARAFQAIFAYQRDVVKDPRGATVNPFTSKMHLMMDTLKVSKSKNRQRFLEKLCSQIDFDFSKLDVQEETPFHVQYSRFVLENLAFFDYVTVGELQGTVAAMEKLFSTTGAPIAHAIESEVFNVRMEVEPTSQAEAESAPVVPTVDIRRLRHCAAASIVLLALWEARTYIRRLYGMGTARKDPKAKSHAKDLNRTPTKAQYVTGDRFWEDMAQIMTGLESRERMMHTCRTFVELMSVDKELKIADEEAELSGEGPTTPINEEDEEAEDSTPGGRGRKRKAVTTPGGRKKRARSSSAQPRKRGRPRKERSMVDADADGDGQWM